MPGTYSAFADNGSSGEGSNDAGPTNGSNDSGDGSCLQDASKQRESCLDLVPHTAVTEYKSES